MKITFQFIQEKVENMTRSLRLFFVCSFHVRCTDFQIFSLH